MSGSLRTTVEVRPAVRPLDRVRSLAAYLNLDPLRYRMLGDGPKAWLGIADCRRRARTASWSDCLRRLNYGGVGRRVCTMLTEGGGREGGSLGRPRERLGPAKRGQSEAATARMGCSKGYLRPGVKGRETGSWTTCMHGTHVSIVYAYRASRTGMREHLDWAGQRDHSHPWRRALSCLGRCDARTAADLGIWAQLGRTDGPMQATGLDASLR